MGVLLGFAPFIGFALLEKMLGVVPGLAAGALISIALLVFDRLKGQSEVNILEAGSAVMFTALVGLAFANGRDAWSLWQVRLWVDSGLLLIVLASIVAGRPFTLHHARRRVSAQVAGSARFLRTNNILSGAWALAFAMLVAADLLMVLHPETPVRLAIGLTLAALAAAAWFTKSYTTRVRGQQADADTGIAR
jgi:FtsH-binding integral membrane protein